MIAPREGSPRTRACRAISDIGRADSVDWIVGGAASMIPPRPIKLLRSTRKRRLCRVIECDLKHQGWWSGYCEKCSRLPVRNSNWLLSWTAPLLPCGTHCNSLSSNRLTASRRRLCFAKRRRLRLAVKRFCSRDLGRNTALTVALFQLE